jgi:ABC-2 type transport system permease protein
MEPLIAFCAAVWSLCVKELLAMVKDPANRTVLFAPVLIQSLLFGYGATFDLTHVPYALLDQSRGQAATDLVARIDGTGVFQRRLTLASSDAIAPAIDANRVTMVLVIPPDFETRLAKAEAAPLQLILDGRNSSTAGQASAQIGAIVAAYNRSRGVSAPITVVPRAWYNPNLLTRWTLMPGLIAGLSLMQTLLIAALSVAREREQGTFDQLLVTPLTPLQIMIGKSLPAMLIGIIQSTLILAIIRLWFQVPMQGSYVLLYGGLVCFTAAAVGIGLSISALALTMQQAMLYTFLLIMPLMLLSGLLTPVRNMPEWLQILTYANPLRFGIDMVRRIYLEGAGLSDIAFDFVPLGAVTLVTLPTAAWLFRHRLS